jgi:hypothetical protein
MPFVVLHVCTVREKCSVSLKPTSFWMQFSCVEQIIFCYVIHLANVISCYELLLVVVAEAARMLSAALKLVSDLSGCVCFRPEHHQSSSLVPTMSAVAHSLSQLQSRVGDADKGTAKKA